MLNFLVFSKSPLHFGHFTFFSEITLSNSSRPALSGMTVLVAQSWFAQGGRTPSLSGDARFNPINFPFVDQLSQLPVLGPIYGELLSGHTSLVYVALLSVPGAWWILYKTTFTNMSLSNIGMFF